MMTRRHFKVIAEAIRSNITDVDQRRLVVTALLPMLLSSNPRFDQARFIEACGVDLG